MTPMVASTTILVALTTIVAALPIGGCASDDSGVRMRVPDRPASASAEPPTFVVHPTPESRVDVHLGDGFALPEPAWRAWVTRATTGIVSYFGDFPAPVLMLDLRPTRGAGVGFGTAFGGDSPWIFVEVGRRATQGDLDEDWVLVHELIHEAFPHLDDTRRWAMEGMATWVEPFIRLRDGTLAREELWARFVERMPYGLPGPGDEGLDRTPTWGRTYWGGALFWMMAEVAVRERSENARGLRDAFRAIVAAGGTKRVMWSFEKTLALGDDALGTPLLMPLWTAWGAAPVAVDLDALWARLGVRWLGGGRVELDDAAPDAGLRLAIERQAW